jgi:hypothetical protein
MDAYNRRLDKGLSGSDVPHGLAVTLLYEVPRFKSNRVVNGAAGRPVCSKPPNPARRSP